MDEEKKEIFINELAELELQFQELTRELKDGCGIYEEENWNRRVEVVRRINEIKKLLT